MTRTETVSEFLCLTVRTGRRRRNSEEEETVKKKKKKKKKEEEVHSSVSVFF